MTRNVQIMEIVVRLIGLGDRKQSALLGYLRNALVARCHRLRFA